METEQINAFSASLARCMASEEFLDRFYGLFLASSPEVAKKFAGTDFAKQKRALSSSLYVMVMAVEGGQAALAYLEKIAERHSRADLDIGPQLYELWLDCLVQAAREHDPEFSDETEAAWRGAMQFGIDFLLSRR